MNADHRRAPLDIEVVRAHLRGESLLWQVIEIVTETGSTNTDLIEAAATGVDITRVVRVSEHQTAGRGRHGRVWSAPARTQVAFSAGVNAARIPNHAWGWLPLLAGVAVVDAVRATCGIAAGLKWPNDVLVASGKLAGILAEVAGAQPVIVIGIGLNATLSHEEAPEGATSLHMLGASKVDRNLILAQLLRELSARISRWTATGGTDEQLVGDYRRLSLTLGTRVRVDLPGDRHIVGLANDVDHLGRLQIVIGNDLHNVSAGDVTHLRPEVP